MSTSKVHANLFIFKIISKVLTFSGVLIRISSFFSIPNSHNQCFIKKKNFAAASESSILPFSGKEAMRYYTVKTHAKLENADSCETQVYLYKYTEFLSIHPIAIKLENSHDRP